MDNEQVMRQKFQAWMHAVDVALVGMCGLSHMDLADNCYWDMFESGMTPQEVAEEVLEDNDFDLDWLE